MKVPFIIMAMVCLFILSPAVPVERAMGQTGEPDVYFETKGLLDSVSGDTFYVNQTPFRITPSTRIIMPAGYAVKILVYEEDLMARVRYKHDEATGGRDIPQAVLVELSERPPQ